MSSTGQVGRDYGGEEFSQGCDNICIRSEFATVTNPRQINISKRDGHTLVVMTCWALKDERLPGSSWRILVLTLAYVANRNIKFSIGERAPYLAFREKEGGLFRIRILDAGAFMFIEAVQK